LQGQSISGLGAQYTVKIDNNSYVSGFGLASTPINGVPTSSFIVLANRFAVATPGQTARYPFVIGTVGGQTMISFRGDMIADGSFVFRDANGNPLLGIGVPLADSLIPDGAKNSLLTPAIDAAQNTADTAAARDVSNLVRKGDFEDGSLGGWNAAAVEIIDDTRVPFTKNLTTHSRDVVAWDNRIDVTAGETMFFAAWLDTRNSNYSGYFGAQVYAADGALIGWTAVVGRGAHSGWLYQESSWTIPDSMVGVGGVTRVPAYFIPWLQQEGFDFSTDNYLHATGLWIGRHARGATVGAPSGTMVGGTEAGLVASRALNGDSAYNALPGINSAIADKLSKTSASDLAARVTLATGGAILAGTTTNGSYHDATGFYGVQGGVVKFSAPISGDPTFGGRLTAAYGSFGAVSIAAGGYLALQATAYNSDAGIWQGFVGGVPKFSIAAANGAKILFDPSAAQPIQLVNVGVASAFNASITDNDGSYYHTVGRSLDGAYAGTYTATPANGVGPYTYSWSVTNYGIVDGWINGAANGQQAALYVNGKGMRNEDGSPFEADFYLQCIVTDTGGNIVRTINSLTTVAFV
jgi:hypothetical protein